MNLSENEEQDKKMQSIQVEEQEQEAGSESETGFLFDLDQDMLLNVLKRVDVVTLGRAACVNKLWREVAYDERLWKPLTLKTLASNGEHWSIDERKHWIPPSCGFRKYYQIFLRYESKPPPSDFNSMVFKPQPFSEIASQSPKRQAIYSRNPKNSQDLLLHEILGLWKRESKKKRT